MGMSASQARLLSITARLSDNESNGQALSYAKQRLADETEQINAEYNSALESTKLTVLTGFNGSSANYSDISYNLMTGYNTVSCGKQYVVTNQKGNVVVSDNLINAYEAGNGDFNVFLNNLGYSQADFPASATDDDKTQQIHDAWDKYFASVGISHEDPNYDTVTYKFSADSLGRPMVSTTKQRIETFPEGLIEYNGKTYDLSVCTDNNGNAQFQTYNISSITYYDYDKWKDGTFSELEEDSNRLTTPPAETFSPAKELSVPKYQFTDDAGTVHIINAWPYGAANGTVAAGYSAQLDKIIFPMDVRVVSGGGRFSGAIAYDDLWDTSIFNTSYTTQTSEVSFITEETTTTPTYINFEGCTAEQRELYDYAVALTLANSNASSNLATVTDDPENANIISYYRNIFNQMAQCGYEKVSDDTKTDSKYFEQQLKDGKLLLKSYSSSDKAFVSTSISEDDAIQEVEDNRLIALAEAKYTQDTQALERKDQKLDLEIKKLDTEHTALQTEYDSVKTVIDKNVETSFKCFG